MFKYNKILYLKYLKKLWCNFELPQNISYITHIDQKSEISSKLLNINFNKMNFIWTSIKNLFKSTMHPGISLCLIKNGKILLNRSIGYLNGIEIEENNKPIILKYNTPICLYSASKSIMSMLIHKAYEKKFINLFDSISFYIPEFGQKGKENISIYQMLSHCSGFPLLNDLFSSYNIFNRYAILDKIYFLPVLCHKGYIQAYHAITSGFIIDELIRRIVGIPLEAFLQKCFVSSMDMEYFCYGLNKIIQNNVALNYVMGLEHKLISNILKKALGIDVEHATLMSNSKKFMNHIIPSANIFSTSLEISKFYQMLLDGGLYKNYQIFNTSTILKATKEIFDNRFDQSVKLPMHFSTGMMLGDNPFGVYGFNSQNSYGHLGFSNIFTWADPNKNISIAIILTGKPILGNHIQSLLKIIYLISLI